MFQWDCMRLSPWLPPCWLCSQVNWHKGTALEHLLESLGLKGCPDVVAIYIGDDHTDEDAFKALRDLRQGEVQRPETERTTRAHNSADRIASA